MATRRAWRWGLGVGLPLLALALFLALFRWDWLIPIIEAQASAKLGRPVKIEHLHVSLGRTITVTAEGLRVGNPPGFPEDPPFAVLPRGSVDVAFAPLLRGEVVIPSVTLDQPQLQVLGRPDGSTNYAFNASGPAGEGAGEGGPKIGALRINGGKVHTAIAGLKADFNVDFHTEEPAEGDPALVADAKGTYAAQPIEARLRSGAILNLRDPNRPWPIDLQLANGPTRVALKGTVRDPVKFAGANLRLDIRTPDMALLRPLIGVPIAPTPPLRVSGQLDYAEGRARFTDVEGTLGSSDIAGDFTVSTGTPTVFTADLRSKRVDLADLGGLIGAQPGREGTPGQTAAQRRALAQAEASPRLIPTTPISVPNLKMADVHVRYRADSIRGKGIPFDGLEAKLDIVDGVIRLQPGKFRIGRGEIATDLTVTPQEGGMPRAQATFDLRRVDISRLMQAAGATGAGTLNGKGKLDATGRSMSEMLGNGDGGLTVISTGGKVSALLTDLSGLQFGRALLSALGIPADADIECMIGDVSLRRGALSVDTLMLDTDSNLVTGGGMAGLGKEILDLWMRTDSKHFSIGSLPTSIKITGTFKQPSIMPEVGELAARAGAATGLGVLFPPLALLPTIQFGVGENDKCEKLARSGGGAEGKGRR
jgi:AsmA family protein